MEAFLGGAYRALAIKCEYIEAELRELRTSRLPEGGGAAHDARNLANRREEAMMREARSATRASGQVAASRARDDRLFSAYQDVARRVLSHERMLLPFLRAYDERAIALTDYCRSLAKTVNWWPSRVPLVAPASTDYFFYLSLPPADALIFAPPLAGRTLLPMPDLVHEMTHAMLAEMDDFVILLGDWAYFDFVNEQLEGQLETDGEMNERAIAKWKTDLEELTCDLIATYVTGPAYAWQHLRLCAGRQTDIMLSRPGENHPSDATRLSAITEMLKLLGETNDLDEIQEAWKAMIDEEGIDADQDDLAYPESAVVKLAETVFTNAGAEDKLRIRPYSSQLPDDDMCVQMNTAWALLRADPQAFYEYEQLNPPLFNS